MQTEIFQAQLPLPGTKGNNCGRASKKMRLHGTILVKEQSILSTSGIPLAVDGEAEGSINGHMT